MPQISPSRHLLWFLFAAIAMATCHSVQAQGYNTALGLRVGRAGGLTAAQRLGKHVSVEAHATTGIFDDGTTVTLLLRRHVPIVLKRVNVFVGGGLHKGWNYAEDDPTITNPLRRRRGNPFGLDLQAGAEVTFGRVNVAFDYLPQINFTGRLNPLRLTSALSVRYVIDKRESSLKARLPWLKENKATERDRAKRKRKRAAEKKRRERQKAREQ